MAGVRHVLALVAAVLVLLHTGAAAVELAFVPYNATLPVCLASPAAIAAERVPAAVAAAPLSVVLVYSAGCGGVARALAAAGAVAALYGARVRVYHCDVGARQTLLGRVADVVDAAPLRPVALPALPALVVYAHGTPVAAPVAAPAAPAAALVAALQRAAPALRRVLAVGRAGRPELALPDAAVAQRLEARLLRALQQQQHPQREPLVHGLAPAAARHAAAAARTWAAKRALGGACAVLLLAGAVRAAHRAVCARRAARAAAARLLRRRLCGPHVLEAEAAPEALALARTRVPALCAHLAPPDNDDDATGGGSEEGALHRALLVELTALKREADAALAVPAAARSAAQRLVCYEQCLALAEAGLLLDAVYRVPLPRAPLRALLAALLDLVVRARAQYAVPVDADAEDIDAAAVAAVAARFRARRRACAHQALVGALVAAGVDEVARVPALATPARAAAYAQALARTAAFFAAPPAHAAATAETAVLAHVQDALRALDREPAARVPGVWRTLHRVAHTRKEPAVAVADFAAVYALHVRRVQQHPAHAKPYDVALRGRVAADLPRVVRAALAGCGGPIPPHGDVLAALEANDAALLAQCVCE